jgi:hypothetical protein
MTEDADFTFQPQNVKYLHVFGIEKIIQNTKILKNKSVSIAIVVYN